MRSTPLALVASLPLIAALVACSGGDDSTGGASASNEPTVDVPVPTSEVASALTASSASGCDADAVAGAGWVATSIAPSSGSFSVTFRATPERAPGASGAPVIDAVVGLSNGAAREYSDLAAAVRFNANGTIDARDGASYRADSAFPYTVGDGPYEFRLDVDVTAHSYSVAVRHLDGVGKPLVTLATGLAFRDEQRAVATLDTVDRFVDGAAGGVETCGLTASSAASPASPATPGSNASTPPVTTPSAGDPAVAPLLRGTFYALMRFNPLAQ